MNLRQAFVSTMVLVGLLSGPVHAADPQMAVLVVGKASDKAMADSERVIVDGLTRARAAKGWSHRSLPIYSYHFDKTVERSYCEERLKVKAADLVVVGLVELESGVPIRFIER